MSGVKVFVTRSWTWADGDERPQQRAIYRDARGEYFYCSPAGVRTRHNVTRSAWHGNQFVRWGSPAAE